ncbi:hypothetical protein ACFV2H_51110 [Streptomyces sp. NPDC059629]
MQDAQREGALAPDTSPEEMGSLLLAVLQGIVGRSALANLPRP